MIAEAYSMVFSFSRLKESAMSPEGDRYTPKVRYVDVGSILGTILGVGSRPFIMTSVPGCWVEEARVAIHFSKSTI
jgi:hypothetical protein